MLFSSWTWRKPLRCCRQRSEAASTVTKDRRNWFPELIVAASVAEAKRRPI